MVLGVILSFFIALANYIGETLSLGRFSKYKTSIASLVAGISVTYIFLHLLPELYEVVPSLNKSLFVFILLGFTIFHLTERLIYQLVKRKKITEPIKLNHAFGLLLYDMSIGIILVNFMKASPIEGFLFFIPVFSHAALSNLSLHKIHGLHHNKEQKLRNKIARFLLAGGTIYGSLLATFSTVQPKVQHTLIGLVAGILLYVVIRETIPKDKEGNPLMFIVGVLLYSSLIFTIWLIA